jgi:glycosyltransferase involved in cell wall biosynthesis
MASGSVALVHDYLLVLRGAERTFAAMAECWPDAPIYTLLYDEQGTRGRFADREVHTSYLQRLGVGQRGFRALLPVFPRAIRSLPLDRYDLIVSSSSAFAHGVIRSPTADHVCYCHTPFRYAWFERERALGEVPAPLRRPLGRTLGRVREADRRASRQVTHYVANSSITQERIRAYWGRESNVVHPPVEVERFRPREEDSESFFLVVTELVRHKQVDLALEAATRAGVPIWVVGEGPERVRLEGRYGPPGQARFLGRVDDAELARLYARARALVLPNVEEFGIAAVEAQAAGRPVVAAAAGGALETVVDGRTGLLVDPGSAEAFVRALAETEFARFDPELIRRHAQGFSEAVFKQRLRAEVESAMGLLPDKGSQVPRAAARVDS